MTKSMEMLPLISITILTSPTVALAQTKARFDHNVSQKTKNQIKFSRITRDREATQTWIVN